MFDCILYMIFSVILKILPSRAAVWILSDVHTTTYVSVSHEMKCYRSCENLRAAEYDRIGPCVRGMSRHRHVSAYLLIATMQMEGGRSAEHVENRSCAQKDWNDLSLTAKPSSASRKAASSGSTPSHLRASFPA